MILIALYNNYYLRKLKQGKKYHIPYVGEMVGTLTERTLPVQSQQ